MLSSHQLMLAAAHLSAQASRIEAGFVPDFSARDANAVRIIVDDARREAMAASGFANLPTLTLRMTVDNDRAMSEHLTALALDMDRHIDGSGCTADELEAVKVTHTADAFRDYLRDDIGERIARTRAGKVEQARVDVVSAMAHYALSEVDWIEVAREYRARALKLGEYAEVSA